MATSTGKRRPPKAWLIIREALMIIFVAICISALIKAFLIQAFLVPSGSMRTTLIEGDRMLVSKLVPDVRQLNRGDVVVFKDSQNWLNNQKQTTPATLVKDVMIALGLMPDTSENHLVKRVIGMPGDRVQCCDAKGRLVVNGVSIDEPYLDSGVAPSQKPFDVKVPADHLWVMGDNRGNSADSRAHMDEPGKGFVPVLDVTGRAFVIIWPKAHWATLSNSTAFAAVPPPD